VFHGLQVVQNLPDQSSYMLHIVPGALDDTFLCSTLATITIAFACWPKRWQCIGDVLPCFVYNTAVFIIGQSVMEAYLKKVHAYFYNKVS
jgi:hypothetical protein